jgi:hypothetical protein
MGVWKGVGMDFLKFYPGPPCPTLLCHVGRPHPQGGRPAAIFYPSGHPTPYVDGFLESLVERENVNPETSRIKRLQKTDDPKQTWNRCCTENHKVRTRVKVVYLFFHYFVEGIANFAMLTG